MKKLNFILVIREMFKDKLFLILNIVGLSISFIACIFALSWIHNEIETDRFNKNIDNIYTIHGSYGNGNYFSGCPPAVGPALQKEFPEVIKTARLTNHYSLFIYEDKKIMESYSFADFDILDIFSFPVIYGTKKQPADNLKCIILTKSIANKFFNAENPVGKYINFDNKYDMLIVGVIEDIPNNSTVKFDMLVPFEMLNLMTENESYTKTWYNNGFRTFAHLHEEASLSSFSDKVEELIEQNNPGANNSLGVRPLKDEYLIYRENLGRVKLFVVLVLMIILIACFNFTNMSTAKSADKAREIGVFKAMGATRFQIISRFYLKVIITVFISFIIGLFFLSLLMPSFNALTGKNINFTYLISGGVLGWMLLVLITTTMIAGIYPALHISGFKPLSSVKSSIIPSKGGDKLRATLVVGQFAISIALIVGALIINSQIKFFRNMDLGMDTEQLLSLNLSGDTKKSSTILKDELLKNPNILNVTATSHSPSQVYSNATGFSWEGKAADFDPLISLYSADEEFIKTFGIEIDEGKFLDKTGNGVVINRKFADMIGWDSFEGKSINWGDDIVIKGVVKNFQFNDFHYEVSPMIIRNVSSSGGNLLFIKIGTDNIAQTLDYIKEVHQKINPESLYPLEYSFLDDEYGSFIKSEIRLGKLVNVFTLMAIILSGLGLFGLATYISRKRTKEIGIRKVNGAKVSEILTMLNKDFIKWVAIAFVIACPIAYYAMNKWLESFAYKTTLSWWIFALAGVLALGIALLTVSWQSWRAATRNPVEVLRYE